MLSCYLDEARPICKRCIDVNFVCLGYRDPFVDGREQVLRRMHLTPAPESSSISTKISSATTQSVQGPPKIYQGSDKTRSISYHYQQPPLCSSLSVLPWKRVFCISYLAANTTGSIAAVCRNIAMYHSESLSMGKSVNQMCFLALATTFFGVSHTQRSLVCEGRRLYGSALQTLSARISDLESNYDDIISAVFALSLHEVCQSSISSYIEHLN